MDISKAFSEKGVSDHAVVVCKVIEDAISFADITAQIQICSIDTLHPILGLRAAVKNLYTPMLSQVKGKKDKESRVETLLRDLADGLANASHIGKSSQTIESTREPIGITSTLDEWNYWGEMKNSKATNVSNKASLVLDALGGITTKWTSISSLTLAETVDLCESMGEHLDKLWKIEDADS